MKQVFLGGACGNTTWRQDIAIPALEAAGITYCNPQLRVNEWTRLHEAAEMQAKAEADALLFVINGESRGVAGVAEVAYLIAARRPLALALTDIPENACINGEVISSEQRNDLNRGRIFVRTMAKQHNVPVFEEIADAVQYAISLVKSRRQDLRLSDVQSILKDIRFKEHQFCVEPTSDGFHLQLRSFLQDVDTGAERVQEGRKWYISRFASRSEIVRTAFKAVVTWQEHEAREYFRYQEARVFSPHFSVGHLVDLWRSTHGEQEVRRDIESLKLQEQPLNLD